MIETHNSYEEKHIDSRDQAHPRAERSGAGECSRVSVDRDVIGGVTTQSTDRKFSDGLVA